MFRALRLVKTVELTGGPSGPGQYRESGLATGVFDFFNEMLD